MIGITAKNARKKTICPAGSAPAALIQEDMATKVATDPTLNTIPFSGLPAAPAIGGDDLAMSVFVPQARASGIGDWHQQELISAIVPPLLPAKRAAALRAYRYGLFQRLCEGHR